MRFLFLMIFLTSTNVLNCSNDLKYGNTSTTRTIPATLPQFLSIVGSFFNDSWYNYPVNSSIGVDNQVNSTRIITDTTGTLIFHETLIIYQLNKTFFKQSCQGPGDDIKTDDFGSFILGYYIETLTGQSICSGSAVLIYFSIEFCTTNLTTAAIGLDEGHVNGIEQIQTLLTIGNFTTCPSIATSNQSSHFLVQILIIFFLILY